MRYVKRLASMLLAAAFIFGLAACGEKAPKNTDVTIEFEEKSVQVALEESVVLKLKVTPESEASKVVWTSSNPDVATVDNQGKVTAKVVGETEVKAAIGDKSATCRVTVTPKEQDETKVTLEIEEKVVKLPIGESIILKLKVTPESEASKVVWTSSNPDVATVDNQGKVTAKVVGETEVKAAIGDKSATCRVTVTPKEQDETKVTLEIEEKVVKLPIGESIVLKLKVTPESEASKVVWTSSNPDVATVDNQGKITSKGFKTAKIKASLGEKTAVCKVIVVVNIGDKLGIGDKPFELNSEISLQYIWDYKTYKDITYKGDKPAIIDFWAPWCGPCKRIAPFVDKLAKEFEGKVYVFKAEVGRSPGVYDGPCISLFQAAIGAPNNPNLRRNIPAFLILPADGSDPKGLVGVGSRTEADIRELLEREIAKEK